MDLDSSWLAKQVSYRRHAEIGASFTAFATRATTVPKSGIPTTMHRQLSTTRAR